MQFFCYYFCQYLLRGAVKIRALTSYSALTELATQNYGQQCLCSKNQQATGKAIFLWTQGLIKQKSPLSVLSNWRLTIEGGSTTSKMGKALLFFGFPNIYFLDSRFLTIQSRAICLQSTIFPFFLFFVCMCMCVTLFLKLFAAGCHLNDCQ